MESRKGRKNNYPKKRRKGKASKYPWKNTTWARKKYLNLDKANEVIDASGLTTNQIHEQSGLSTNTIRSIRRRIDGYYYPETCEKLARGLGVRPGDIMNHFPEEE